MSAPSRVSVVMAVYNDEATLPQAMESVLGQQGVELEFIVVIDGSMDESPAIVERFANADKRVKIISRENRGLTQSLIEGCAAATEDFIARQDADDMSLPGRLQRQASLLEQNSRAVLVGCGSRFTTWDGHELYNVFPDADLAMQQVANCDLNGLRLLTHGTAMFRARAYRQVGGYRPHFYFAQDVDLWFRLLESGRFATIDDVLYLSRQSARAISSLQRPEQVALARLSLETARARRQGRSEEPFLSAAAKIRPAKTTTRGGMRARLRQAGALYFFGCCLADRGNSVAKDYFVRSVLTWPFQFRSWYRLLRVW